MAEIKEQSYKKKITRRKQKNETPHISNEEFLNLIEETKNIGTTTEYYSLALNNLRNKKITLEQLEEIVEILQRSRDEKDNELIDTIIKNYLNNEIDREQYKTIHEKEINRFNEEPFSEKEEKYELKINEVFGKINEYKQKKEEEDEEEEYQEKFKNQDEEEKDEILEKLLSLLEEIDDLDEKIDQLSSFIEDSKNDEW